MCGVLGSGAASGAGALRSPGAVQVRLNGGRERACRGSGLQSTAKLLPQWGSDYTTCTAACAQADAYNLRPARLPQALR